MKTILIAMTLMLSLTSFGQLTIAAVGGAYAGSFSFTAPVGAELEYSYNSKSALNFNYSTMAENSTRLVWDSGVRRTESKREKLTKLSLGYRRYFNPHSAIGFFVGADITHTVESSRYTYTGLGYSATSRSKYVFAVFSTGYKYLTTTNISLGIAAQYGPGLRYMYTFVDSEGINSQHRTNNFAFIGGINLHIGYRIPFSKDKTQQLMEDARKNKLIVKLDKVREPLYNKENNTPGRYLISAGRYKNAAIITALAGSIIGTLVSRPSFGGNPIIGGTIAGASSLTSLGLLVWGNKLISKAGRLMHEGKLQL